MSKERREPSANRTAKTMADVSHTHPHTGETFGGAFTRGPAVADGGSADAGDGNASNASSASNAETMGDVRHEAPNGDAASEMWMRGAPAAAEDDRSESDKVRPTESRAHEGHGATDE